MTLRSPLGKVLGLGAAHAGVRHWWAQRVTAVGLALLAPWFLLSLMLLRDLSYSTMYLWVAQPCNTALLCLLLLTLFYHSHLGVQVVVEDYVAHKTKKTVLLLLIDFALIILALMGVLAVLRISLDATGAGP